MRICDLENCDIRHYAKGWCEKHYLRWRKWGDPTKTEKPRFESFEESFLENTVWQGECLMWSGNKTYHSYGQIKVKGVTKTAHRYAWERAHGTIPEGFVIDHKDHCATLCCNVDHLRLATTSQNGQNRGGVDKHNKSGYRNVYWSKGKQKWVVSMRRNNKNYYFGSYSDIEEAAKVAEQKRKELFGEFAGKG